MHRTTTSDGIRLICQAAVRFVLGILRFMILGINTSLEKSLWRSTWAWRTLQRQTWYTVCIHGLHWHDVLKCVRVIAQLYI